MRVVAATSLRVNLARIEGSITFFGRLRMTPMMCVPNLADFLTLADESRLVAIIRHCDFIRVPEMPKVFFGVAYSSLRCHTGTTTNIITSSETLATDMKCGWE